MQPSKAVFDKLALVKAKISGNSSDAVQVLLAEFQTALQEVEERKTIEATLNEQVRVLGAGYFLPDALMKLPTNDTEARRNRRENLNDLQEIYNELSKALDDIEDGNPELDTSRLASAALSLGALTDRIARLESYLDANARIQPQDNATANGTVPSDLEESILSAYLEMAKFNIANGQILIDRIATLEICLGCNDTNNKKRKRGCDSHHVGMSPDFLHVLINRLTEEIPPQADLVAKITELLTVLRVRLEQRTREISSHKRSFSDSQDVEMSNDGLDTRGLLQISLANVQNGEILINRITELESELHALKHRSPVASDGDSNCPKELENAKKQLKDLTAQLKDKEDKLENLTNRLCNGFDEYLEENFNGANSRGRRIAGLKDQIEKLKKEKFEVEKRRDICKFYNEDILEPTVKAREQEIRQLKIEIIDRQVDRINNEALLEGRMKILAELDAYHLGDTINFDIAIGPARKAEEYAALLTKIKLLKNKLEECQEVQGNPDEDEEKEMSDSDFEEEIPGQVILLDQFSKEELIERLAKRTTYQAEIYRLNDEMEQLKADDEQRQRMWVEENAELRIGHISEMSEKNKAYEEQNVRIASLKDEVANLKSKLKNCREFRDNVLQLGINELEEPHDLEGLDNATLVEEIIELQCKLKALGVKYEEAVRNDQNFDSASELDEDLAFQNPRQQIRDLQAWVEELRAKLTNCREENEDKVDNPEDAASMVILKKGIQKLREERDDGVDKADKLEKEVDRLIGLLRTELAARQRDLDAEKELAKQQAQKEANYETIIRQLTERLHDANGDERANRQLQNEAEYESTIRDLMQRLADNEATQQSEAEYKETIWELTERLSSIEVAHEAKIKKMNDLIVEANRDLDGCLEMRQLVDQVSNYLKATSKERCEEIEMLEAQLAANDQSVPEQVQALKDQVAKLKKELADCKRHATANDENIDALEEDLEACEEEKGRLQEEYNEQLKEHRKMAITTADQYEAKIRNLEEQLEQAQQDSSTAASHNGSDVRVEIDKLEKLAKQERLCEAEKAALCQKIKELEEKLADFEATSKITGIAPPPRKRRATTADSDEDQDPDALDDCVAAVAKLTHKIAALDVERTSLWKQLQDLEDIYNVSGNDHSSRNKRQRKPKSQQQRDGGEYGGEGRSLQPMDDKDFAPRLECNEEIEALTNQITAQKEKIVALEQQAALDAQQIDALSHSNTDKSQKYQKLTALINNLRAELEHLQTRLLECRFLIPFWSKEEEC